MIALITPSGGRPMQFDLCMKWMQRQTYEGKVVWVIVDDCHPRTTDIVNESFRENWTIIKTYPLPIWNPGQNTQVRNIQAGIRTLLSNYSASEIEAVFIIEDDDYYRARYLERMMINFDDYSLIGERNTIYYNVAWRRFVTNPNTIHASLFQTAFRLDVLPIFEKSYSAKFVDCLFWSLVPNRHLFYENDLAVGMKGMPGRGGIGAGHSRAMNMRDDSNLNYLRGLIGPDDAACYEVYYKTANFVRYDILTKKRL